MVPPDDGSKNNNILTMSCHFTLSGIITPMHIGGKLIGGCIDPTCMSIIVYDTEGALTSFEIPGLVAEKHITLNTKALQVYHMHSGPITSLRVSVMGDSDVRILRAEKLDNLDLFAMLLQGPEKLTVGYTLQELRHLAQLSSLVSCSADKSLILWRFVIDSVGNRVFLLPYPQQK